MTQHKLRSILMKSPIFIALGMSDVKFIMKRTPRFKVMFNAMASSYK